MRLSLNEVEICLRRAALGCGVPQGYAEDLGACAAWLCAQGFAGVPTALAELEAWAAGESGVGRLTVAPAPRLAGDGAKPLAAWHLGPSAADLLRAGLGPLGLDPVAHPLLVLGALGNYSAAKGPGLLLRWETGAALCRNGAPYLVAGDWAALEAPLPAMQAACAGPRERGVRRAAAAVLDAGVPVDPGVWARVQTLVHRSLVPASQASRATGAGAGLVDAD